MYSLLVVVAIYVVVFVFRSLRSTHSDVQGTPINSEAFPKIDIFNPMEPENGDVSLENRNTTEPTKAVAKRNVAKEKGYKAIVAAPEFPAVKQEQEKISLKNRSEAKRAFIHAEIFNRKY